MDIIDNTGICNMHDIFHVYGLNDKQYHNLIGALTVIGDENNISYFKNIKEVKKNCFEAIDELNENLQKEFIRPSGVERQQFAENFNKQSIRDKLILLLSDFLEAIHLGDKQPVKIVLGAAENTVKIRLNTIINLENKNIHTDKVFLLGGQRDLWLGTEDITKNLVIERLIKQHGISIDQAEEEVQKAQEKFFLGKKSLEKEREDIVNYFVHNRNIIWPTESDMMLLESKKHPALSGIEFILVDSPKKYNKEGKLVRPDTLDTFVKFIQDYNFIGDIGIVSSQPFALYQWQQAMVAFDEKPINVYMVSDEYHNIKNVNFSVLLDSVARFFYTGKSISKMKIDKSINSNVCIN